MEATKEKLQEIVSTMTEEEMKILLEKIPAELCLERVYQELALNRKFRNMIHSAAVSVQQIPQLSITHKSIIPDPSQK